MAIDAPKKGRRSSGARGAKAADEPVPSGTTTSQVDPKKNWASDPESRAYQQAIALYPQIRQAYRDKENQSDLIVEYWNIYNAQADNNQQYTGNSQGYVPAIRDAINARAKRALKQLFPSNGRHVDGVSSETDPPYVQLSLLEYYIRKIDLENTVRTDLIAGDVTGQWNLMVDWTKSTRTITKLVTRNPIVPVIDGEEPEEMGLVDPLAEEEATEQEEITEEGPTVVDFATEDLAVVPPTCTDLQKAKAVSVRLKMSAQNVKDMVEEGVFILPPGTDIEAFCKGENLPQRRDPSKKAVYDAGIRMTEGADRFALIYYVYADLDFGDGNASSGIIYYAGQDEIIGIIKNPLWSGKRPILSNPVERKQGSFFGRSKIEPVKFIQWNLTDFWNMGQDAAMYSMLPIYRVNPLTTPNWAQLTMGLAAMWPVAPNDLEPLVTPALWKDSLTICDQMERRIWQSMDVNEMMMGRMPAGRKNNAMIGGIQQEQTVSISDHASRYELVMLNPLAEMLFELDQQFRTKELMIEQRGEIGAEAAVKTIPVQQWGARYFFRWTGTEFMLGAQMLQQQIAAMNVIKGIPPQMLNGRRVDVTPIIVNLVENVFGPDQAPKILIDERNQFTVSPEVEDEILHNGMPVTTHEADDDVVHLQAHIKAAAVSGDPLGLFKTHMGAHMAQRQRKLEMQMAQGGAMRPPGAPGGPGGGQGTVAPPGVAGTPRPGSQPGVPRNVHAPAGAVNADSMSDPQAGGRG